MTFLCGTENMYGKNELETIKMLREENGPMQKHNLKREYLHSLLMEVDLEKQLNLNNLQKSYGSLYQKVYIMFKCFQEADDYVGKISFKFNNIFKAVHSTYVFPIDEFISATKEMQKSMLLKGIIDSLVAIKEKKKGDFKVDKLANDISCIFSQSR